MTISGPWALITMIDEMRRARDMIILDFMYSYDSALAKI
jgi:hypothetical protein